MKILFILVKNINMTIQELKEWLNGLSDEQLVGSVYIRDLKEMEDNKIGQRDLPVALGFVDINNNKLCLCDPSTAEIIQKIRANNNPETNETPQ